MTVLPEIKLVLSSFYKTECFGIRPNGLHIYWLFFFRENVFNSIKFY